MWKGEEESGRVELQTVKKDGGGGGSACRKAENLFSHSSSRKREDLVYVLLEIHQVLCPVCSTFLSVSRLFARRLSLSHRDDSISFLLITLSVVRPDSLVTKKLEPDRRYLGK